MYAKTHWENAPKIRLLEPFEQHLKDVGNAYRREDSQEIPKYKQSPMWNISQCLQMWLCQKMKNPQEKASSQQETKRSVQPIAYRVFTQNKAFSFYVFEVLQFQET